MTANQTKVREVRALILQAIKLTDELHTDAANLQSHNLSIDVEAALRTALPPLAALFEAEAVEPSH